MGKVSATAVALAAIGLLAVALVSEVAVEQGETVLTEDRAVSEVAAAAASTARWAQRTELAEQQQEDVAPIDNSRDVTAKVLSQTQALNHEANHAVRHSIRERLASGATNVVKDQIKTLTKQAQKMAKHAAEKTAEQMTDQAMSQQPANTKGDKAVAHKLELLKKDKELLEAALENEKAKAAQETHKQEEQDKEYRAQVSKKVTQAKQDFESLKDELKSYEGTNAKEHDTREQLHKLLEDIDRDKDKLQEDQDRLDRMKDRQKAIVSASEEDMSHQRDKLKGTLSEYKTTLKGLKEKLGEVKNAADINKEIARRITSAQDILSKQNSKISQLSTDLSSLQKELKRTTVNIKALTQAAKEKKHALHLAQGAVEKLTETAANLKNQAERPVPEVRVDAPRGDSAASAKKAVRKVMDAVKSTTVAEKPKVVANAVEEARHAAKKEAAKLLPETEIQVPGASTALEQAEKTLGELGVQHSNDTEQSDPRQDGNGSDDAIRGDVAEHPPSVLIEPEGTVMDHALQKAGQTLTRLHFEAEQDKSIHKAELLSHVAHVMFMRAQKSGSALDKAAAKVAMKRAIAARSAVGHKVVQAP